MENEKLTYVLPSRGEKWKEIVKILTKCSVEQPADFINILSKIHALDEKHFGTLSFAFEFGRELTTSFIKIVPNMIKEIANIDSFFKEDLPILNHPLQSSTITLTKKQIRILLACSFFGLLLDQKYFYPEMSFELVPITNFSTIFRGGYNKQESSKILCLMNYFVRMYSVKDDDKILTRKVSFSKIVFNEPPKWEESTNISMPKNLLVHSDKTTIEECENCTMTDFANEFIGGLIYKGGCVQEEIAFVIKPECLISMLLCTRMIHNESIHFRGIERYSKYSGYANSFQFDGNYFDNTEIDEDNFVKKELIAIDALPFSFIGNRFMQFEKKYIDRELFKAYCGFYDSSGCQKAIATGNWGCGMFGGDVKLKSIIQLLAAAQFGRDMVYCSFGQEKFSEELKSVHEFLSSKTVGEVYKKLINYSPLNDGDIFKYLMKK